MNPQVTPSKTEHFDIIIVGAGISGIGGAYHISKQCPGTSFLVLEALESYGGTWLSHRFPGIRSDSDLHTFGYRFKPWKGALIGTGPEILRYLGETIEENDLGPHIRYHHKITSASWSSKEKLWKIEGTRTDTGETVHFTTNFLWMCQGYYRLREGHRPEWEGMGNFKGTIVHTENWPEQLDYKDKRVVVIGSGATAASVVPAMALEAAHVTMVQRSPTWYRIPPLEDVKRIAAMLRFLKIDEVWVHEIVRRMVLHAMHTLISRTFTEPDVVSKEFIEHVRTHVGADVDTRHFLPSYRPWQQRLAILPDGDFFKVLREGKSSIETDEIERFTETGLVLKSGKTLDADIVVLATGFNLNVLGDINFSLDGKPMVFSDTVTYHGLMFTGVPNMVWVLGYLRTSWTLRADMAADFVCGLIKHMKKKGVGKVTVELRPEDKDMKLGPYIDPENFNPGYLTRGLHLLPKRGDKAPWLHSQDYWSDKDVLPAIDFDDVIFHYQ